ncbi:MAG: hypothetical protein OEM52_15180, partial [bacterium]|nr:hypothetical protein [bacterium]
SYAVRNSIVLAVLLMLVHGVGWFAFVIPMRKESAKLRKEIILLEQKITADAALPLDIENSKKSLDELRKRWLDRKKILPKDENTRLSYGYINGLVNRTSKPFPFDFDFNDQKDTMGLMVRRYSFRADATYQSLYDFISFFENHKRLMIITDIQMDAKPLLEGEDARDNLTSVNAKLVAYSSASGNDSIASQLPKALKTRWNPFKALVTDRLPRNEDNLVEVNRAKLVAITAEQAYVQDQGSKLIVLKEGDPVYLGFVTRIDANSARVEFTLNYGGFIRKRTLDLVRESVVGGSVRKTQVPGNKEN